MLRQQLTTLLTASRRTVLPPWIGALISQAHASPKSRCLAGMVLVPWLQCGLLFGEPPAVNDGPATVRVMVVNDRGDILPYAVTKFRSVTTQQDFASRFGGGLTANVPYGEYRVVVGLKGAECRPVELEKTLIVEKTPVSAVWVGRNGHESCMSLDSHVPSWYHLRIRIESTGRVPDHVRVRLVNLTGEQVLDCLPDPRGLCDIRDHVKGMYALSVVKGRDLLYEEVVLFGGSLEPPDVVVKLKGTPLAPRVVP